MVVMWPPEQKTDPAVSPHLPAMSTLVTEAPSQLLRIVMEPGRFCKIYLVLFQ
jgi:hypothetical protein